jgi:hypothetical protein
MSVAGTIKKVTLDGVTYDVPADINISEMGSGFENSLIPTSGRNVLKQVKRAEIREGVVLIVDDLEMDRLKELAERQGDGEKAFPMSYQTAAGVTKRATGWIEFANRETEENRAAITLLPEGSWSTFS